MNAIETKPKSEPPSEATWEQFLRDLQAWEIHKLHTLGELDLHDKFMEGQMKLMDIFVLVCIDGDVFKGNTEHSVKVS